MFHLSNLHAASPAGPVLHAITCNASAPTQQWDFDAATSEIQQRGAGAAKLCVDINGYSKANEGVLQLFACHPEDKSPTHANQAWSWDATTKEIKATGCAKGKCIDVSNYGASGSGSVVWTYQCDGTPNQQWSYDKASGALLSLQTGTKGAKLCLDSGKPPPVQRPCDVASNAKLPWCDSTLPLETRVKDLVDRITPAEIVGLFSNTDHGVASMKIPPYQWWSEALHGVGGSPGVTFGGDTPTATSHPQVITTGSTFNNSLFGLIGAAISDEARAFNNVGHAGNTFWTPNVNIFRDPRWGRGQETPGEDPTHNAEYAASFVPGMQGGVSPQYIKASSCLKHYFAYNLENWHGVDRHHFDAIVDEQDLTDTYLPPFQSGVQRGNASGLMCSYNSVNGVPSCGNKAYLNGKIRKEWGFDGYVTSDCGAVSDVQNNHHYTKTGDNTSFVVLDAGMDSDCGGFLNSNLGKAISDGAVTKSTWGPALTNLFRVRMRLGQFDPIAQQPYLAYGLDKINSAPHQALAYEAARQGLVLLKNTAKTLPLNEVVVETVAVVGPLADNGDVMLGNYHGTPPFKISVASGMGAAGVGVTIEAGLKSVSDSSTDAIPMAVAAAAAADATIIVAGLDQSQESEGHDRTVITMPGAQDELITKVAAAAKGPVVLVLLSGGAIDVSAHVANPKIGAILWGGYPGQSGGTAIAETLFGRNNPSGKLTQTWYPEKFVNATSFFAMGMRPNASTGYEGRTHRFYTGSTVFKFGDGLSYSAWTHTNAATASASVSSTLSIDLAAAKAQLEATRNAPHTATALTTVQIDVRNDGPLRGDHVVLAFLSAPRGVAGVDGAPLQSLATYSRLGDVAVNATRRVEFAITAHHIANALGAVRDAASGEMKLEIRKGAYSLRIGSGAEALRLELVVS